MLNFTTERNYIPIDLDTKFYSCLRIRESKWSIKKVTSYYHVNRKSLFRWLKIFDGSKESLINKSHKPLSDHPKKKPEEIVKRVLDLHRRNPDQSFIEIWCRLRHEKVEISASTVLRIFKRNDEFVSYKPHPKKHDKVYHTPKTPHDKWQVDVKFVPSECKANALMERFYQYTVLDECSRKRFLYFTQEHSMYETVKCLRLAHEFFGCLPLEIQTDNGFEFTDKDRRNEKSTNSRPYDNFLERYCKENNLKHHLIRPRTPQHNGKVERSHRIDQDKFYRYLKFYNLEDLRKQGKAWNKRYNNIPKCVLGFKTPNEVEVEKLKELLENTGEIRCQRCLTSSDN